MKRVVIVGSGNVAEAFACALADVGAAPVQVFARDIGAASEIAAMAGSEAQDDPAGLAAADLYIVSVTDKAIRKVVSGLDFGDAVVAHTAASVGLDVFPQAVRNRAVLYPLQTFTRGRRVEFKDIPLFIEANNPRSLECVREVASSLSGHVIETDSARRSLMHVAAVFAGNFSNYMYTAGEEIMRDAGLDFSLLKPLILETALKAAEARSPREVQTGPAVRNDFNTRARHCELLSQKPDLMNMYINISKSIWETSKKT